MDSYHREEDVSMQAGDRTDRKWKTKLRTTFYPCMTVREATMTKTVLDLTMELKTTETHKKIRSINTTKNNRVLKAFQGVRASRYHSGPSLEVNQSIISNYDTNYA